MKRLTIVQIKKKFGKPAKPDGTLDKAWQRANIVVAPMPFPMTYAGKEVRTCQLHRLAADSFTLVLTAIWNHYRVEVKEDARPALRVAVKRHFGYGEDSAFYDAEVEKRIKELGTLYWNHETLARLKELGLTNWGGSLNFRPVRGASSLSMHAYGIAVDIDPAHNQMGTTGRMPQAVIDAFESRGWYWGGRFSRRDPMHFEMTAA